MVWMIRYVLMTFRDMRVLTFLGRGERRGSPLDNRSELRSCTALVRAQMIFNVLVGVCAAGKVTS